MIVDLERNETMPAFAAEVCIVGAGAAGIVLATELVRQGKRVLLLESGGAAIEAGAQQLNECSYAGQPHQAATIGRFRALGGTTTAWGGQILEFLPEDFTVRPWVPGSGWPFPKKTLEPYYERALFAEGLEQVDREDAQVWRMLKKTVPELGDELEPYFTRWCPEPNFARLYRETLASPNLCVLLHATATAILLNENGFRVRGLCCKTPEGREHIFSATHYVLCLGTIETVRFLLQPLPDVQTPIWNRSDLLGRNFKSHIDLNTARIPVESAPQLHPFFANAYLHGYKYHPKFYLRSPVQEKEKILNIAGSITCLNPVETELRRVKAMARSLLRRRAPSAEPADLARLLRQLPTMLQLAYCYRVRRRAAWPKSSIFWLRVHCEQEPLSSSRITLTDARDAAGLLRAKLDWRVSPLEWETIRHFTDEVERSFIARGWGNIAVRPELAREDGYVNVTFDNSHHDMGGTRMAASAAEGVVDPNLRLHGLDNAYLCSASVFPTSGFSNPTHTLIALAIRLADHLKENTHA